MTVAVYICGNLLVTSNFISSSGLLRREVLCEPLKLKYCATFDMLHTCQTWVEDGTFLELSQGRLTAVTPGRIFGCPGTSVQQE